jgi:hypothetical protein
MKGFMLNWDFIAHQTGAGVPDGSNTQLKHLVSSQSFTLAYPIDPIVVIDGIGKISMEAIENSMNYWCDQRQECLVA